MAMAPWQERFRRRRLPHIEVAGAIYFVTFRLNGSLPVTIADDWQRCHLGNGLDTGRPATLENGFERACESLRSFDEQLENGAYGPQHLSDARVAEMMVGALRHFAGVRYVLPAYVLMPNHGHMLIQPLTRAHGGPTWGLDQLMHSLKSYTAHEANKLLRTSGPFWQREYYDHLVRNDDEFGWYMEYILFNPVKAGLCKRPEDWPWSNAAELLREHM